MKRKLKTIQKILEENPRAFFDTSGFLIINGQGVMSPDHFHILGKDYDGSLSLPESFCEPEPEKKKIYFYRESIPSSFYMETTPNGKGVIQNYVIREDKKDAPYCGYLGSITLDVE